VSFTKLLVGDLTLRNWHFDQIFPKLFLVKTMGRNGPNKQAQKLRY